MNKKIIFFLVLFLWTCSSSSKKSPTEPEEVFVVDLSALTGQVQKGPFNNGTSIVVSELSNNLSPTGRNFNSSINDNTGRFTVANVQLVSPYVELRANGFYFNEVSNGISDSQLTLSAISDLTSKTSLNVNVLTHLEKNRIQFLITGENPLSFSAAKLQAQEEVLGIFDFSRANMPESEVLDISQAGVSNAKLLAISAILQGNLTVGQMSELLANISTDITSDGVLDDQNLRNTLINNSKNLNLSSIRTNLEARFTSLGIQATVADFESEVNNFLKPPSAVDISTSTDEDTPINITLDGSDPEDETLTYALVEVNNASVSLDGNVALYTPDLNWNGTDTFTYKVNDGTSDSNIATVTVVVGEVDDEPNTLDISTSTDEDIAVVMNLTAEEYDGDSYSFAIVSQPSNGQVSLSSATATYTPAQDFNGTDTFTFQATDDAGRRLNVATATITVNAVNDAPVANDITNQVTDENKMMQLDITLVATDVEGDPLTYHVASTNNGSVTINDNIATYIPTQDWNGEDTFTYIANDGSLDSNAATVTITVNSVNDAPVVEDRTSTGAEDTVIEDSFSASDVDGDELTYSIVSQPSNGSVSLREDGGGFEHTPDENWNGTDTFTFKGNDGELDSNIGTITLIITPVNDAPTAVAVNKTMDEDGGTIDVETNYNDVDGDTDLTFTLVDAPSNGTATVGIPGSYIPNANFHGTDTFTYTVTDAEYTSDPATVTITVNSVNDAPVTSNISQTQDENNSEASDLSSFTTDVDGNSLTYTIVSDVTDGSTSLDGSVVTYTPNANFDGTDSYTYKANDGTVDSNISTVTITVNDVNTAPVATNYTVNNGTEDTDYLIDVLTTDNSASGTKIAYDADGDDLTVSIVSQGANGTATVSGAIITYSPNADWNGTDQISFKVNDGSADSNTATITYNIASVIDRSYLDFDGVDDRVEFDVDWTLFEGYTTNTSGEGAGINSSTLSMWLNLDVQGSQPIYTNVIGTNSVGEDDDQWLSTDGGGTFEFKRNLNNGQTHNLQSTVTANTNVWFHLMIVREKGISGAEQNGDDLRKGWRIYIDGTFRGSLYDSGTRTLTDLGMYLGYADSNAGFSIDEYFNGSIDSFALWDDFLTPDEVTAVYGLGRDGSLQSNSGNYTSAGDLMLYFDFDEISGTTVEDRVGTSSQNATIVGATIVTE